MRFADFAPAATPALAEQRSALRQGLGRAWQWAINGCLDAKTLLKACLQDQRYDGQVEGARGDWLWSMIEALHARERFRVPILHALYDLDDDCSAEQLCQLARCYAEAGDETFRRRLYEIVEHKPITDSPWLGEEEILALDGERAFVFAARVRGEGLVHRQWDWDDGNVAELAVQRWGEEYVSKLLQASSDEAVQRFGHYYRQDQQTKAQQRPHGAHRDRMAATPIAEVFRAAESAGKGYWLRGWGIHADESALRLVLQRLWRATEPQVIANLLRVFSGRALPEFDARLIPLCQHADEGVRHRAFAALAQNAHPLVRQFALNELRNEVRGGSVFGLFTKNYQEGDEERILDAIALPDSEDDLHWLLMDVVKVLEGNPEADGSRLGVIVYASTPCANCRFSALELLGRQQVAPEWLKQECRHDCNDDCRAWATRGTG